MIRRNAAFVAEGDLHLVPRQIAGCATRLGWTARGVLPPVRPRRKRPRAAMASRACVEDEARGVLAKSVRVENARDHISLHGRENCSARRAGAEDVEFEQSERGFADRDAVVRRQAEQMRGELAEIRLVADEHDAALAAIGAQFLERALRMHAAGEPRRDEQFRAQRRRDDLRRLVRAPQRAA